MKPWEETWTAGVSATVYRRLPDEDVEEEIGRFLPYHGEHTDPAVVARARLASAAPELLRLLAEAEWSGTRGWGPPTCPWCDEFAPQEFAPHAAQYYGYPRVSERTGHRADCRFVAVMAKARGEERKG